MRFNFSWGAVLFSILMFSSCDKINTDEKIIIRPVRSDSSYHYQSYYPPASRQYDNPYYPPPAQNIYDDNDYYYKPPSYMQTYPYKGRERNYR